MQWNVPKRNTPEGTSASVIKFLANVALDIRKESIRDGGRMSQEADNTNICKNLKVPVLILSGGKDTVISTEMHASLIAALPRAHKVVFPKRGMPLLLSILINLIIRLLNLQKKCGI